MAKSGPTAAPLCSSMRDLDALPLPTKRTVDASTTATSTHCSTQALLGRRVKSPAEISCHVSFAPNFLSLLQSFTGEASRFTFKLKN